MARHGMTWLGMAALLLIAAPFLHADPVETAALESTLALQRAMLMAKAFLRMDDSKRAVEVLEQNLGKANGHTAYLELLRDAYRAYIKELGLKNQGPFAQRYWQRLMILDPSAANDPSLRKSETPIFVPPAPVKEEGPPLPKFTALPAKAIAPPKIEVTAPAPLKAPTIRAIREMPGDDPFDGSHQRIAPTRIAGVDPERASTLLTKANQEFERRRYSEARAGYEQLVKLDGKNIDRVRDRLAYCILDSAVEQLNSGASAPLPEIRQQVVGAIEMAPQLRKTGDWLLKEIDQRGQPANPNVNANVKANDAAMDPPLNMQHFGKNPQGWQVTETTNFRIFHNQNRELVERVARIAEQTRVAMSRKWFGNEGETWTPKCEIVMHASAADYSRLTSVPASSPGHSRIETDPTSYRVIGRRIDLHTDTMGMLEAVLPHETTHIVLAGNFGNHQVPRWADEGMAVLSEPLEKIEQHRRNLAKSRKDGSLGSIRELMNLQNYPEAKQITAFYAQSVILVEFLTQQRGAQVFTEFLREGLRDGYEPALRKHYSMTFAELQGNWDRYVGASSQTAAAGR
jgi:tetratricopeptide (TPR) repeat protein